jgi:hypothetical protein
MGSKSRLLFLRAQPEECVAVFIRLYAGSTTTTAAAPLEKL